jgi:hypothetical protein
MMRRLLIVAVTESGRLRWRFDTDRKSEPSPRASSRASSCGTPYSDSEHRFSWWRLLVEVQ